MTAAFTSLLPDLDAAESKIKHLSFAGAKPLLIPATITHRVFGHRGVLHTLAGAGAFTIISLPLTRHEWPVWAAARWYLSHLCADACTCKGIPFFDLETDVCISSRHFSASSPVLKQKT